MRTYKTEGIILKRLNFSEADKIITIFSKHYGKITAIAKGVRKLTSRKASSLDLFNHSVLFFAKGKSLDIITEAQTVSSFLKMKKKLRQVAIALQICELTDKLTRDRQENYQLFCLLENSLKKLDENGEEKDLLIVFKKKILKILGFGNPLNPTDLNLDGFIEEIAEKRLFSKSLLKKMGQNG